MLRLVLSLAALASAVRAAYVSGCQHRELTSLTSSRHSTPLLLAKKRVSKAKGGKAAFKAASKAASPNLLSKGFGGAIKPPKGVAPPGKILPDAKYEALTAWLQSEGANLRKVAIADFGGLRGDHSNGRFPPHLSPKRVAPFAHWRHISALSIAPPFFLIAPHLSLTIAPLSLLILTLLNCNRHEVWSPLPTSLPVKRSSPSRRTARSTWACVMTIRCQPRWSF